MRVTEVVSLEYIVLTLHQSAMITQQLIHADVVWVANFSSFGFLTGNSTGERFETATAHTGEH